MFAKCLTDVFCSSSSGVHHLFAYGDGLHAGTWMSIEERIALVRSSSRFSSSGIVLILLAGGRVVSCSFRCLLNFSQFVAL